jgi:endonuclease-3
MAKPDRGALITKTHKILKKHYKPVEYAPRPLLENLLFAACLENARYEAAEAAYKALAEGFFDWNEVRVSTVEELAEAISMHPDRKTAATNTKKLLYSVFESTYSFELENMKKLNLGAAIQKLEKLEGATPFIVAAVTQASLGGHSIPLDHGAFIALKSVGIAADSDESKGVVPGLERAIPKSKGVEFGSLLHQFGADLFASPYSTNLHKVLLEINPAAKDQLPKRPSKSAAKAPPPPAPELKKARKPDEKGRHPESEKKHPAPPAKKPEAVKKSAAPVRKPEKVSPKKKSGASIAKRKPR